MSKTTSALLILSLYVLANLNNGVEAAGRGSIPRTDAEKDHHNDLLYGPQHWFFFSPFFHPFWFGHLLPWFPLHHDSPPFDIPPYKGDGGYGPGPFGGDGLLKGGGKGPIDGLPVKGGDGGYGGKGPIDVPPVKGGDDGGGKGPIDGPPIKGDDVSYYGKSSLTGTDRPKHYKSHG
ncbi:hypothetical protein AAHE18_14G122600 [Arachis hypogaea]|nr:uncharacterized protein DS421_14g464890 [Arachis hypogaea]